MNEEKEKKEGRKKKTRRGGGIKRRGIKRGWDENLEFSNIL